MYVCVCVRCLPVSLAKSWPDLKLIPSNFYCPEGRIYLLYVAAIAVAAMGLSTTANLQGEEISNLYSAHRSYEGLGIWGKASADSVTLTSNLTAAKPMLSRIYVSGGWEEEEFLLIFCGRRRLWRTGPGQFRLSSKNTIYRLDVHRTTDVRLSSSSSFLHVAVPLSVRDIGKGGWERKRESFERQPRKRPQLR